MSKTETTQKNKFGRVGRWFEHAFEFFDDEDPLIIMPYRGYASVDRFFLMGRVLENEGIFMGKSESEIRNLIDSFKRFESDELPGAKVCIRLGENYYETITNEDGYFAINANWQSPPEPTTNRWLKAEVHLMEVPKNEESSIMAEAELLYPSKNATYGIITDVDDTVLQTHVTSRFRLKMLYATFFQDSHKRLPMDGVVELFQSFVKGADGRSENPIFYVSNSPWNLYDLLEDFMDVQGLPKGPILLRDYGISHTFKKVANENHKLETISHIMQMYPNLPFLMLGDTASKDADFYLQLATEFPGRIRAVYIRHTRDNRNARRVAQLIEANSTVDAVLVESTEEIFTHARKHGYLAS